jgi:putative SOS response-associated peptidase YedK
MVSPVHERMPVMLSGDALWDWLADQPKQLINLLRPYPADRMERFPGVHSGQPPGVDTPELIQPVPI